MECYGDDDQFFMRHRKAPPSIDISILAGDASVGYALFDYGLTEYHKGTGKIPVLHFKQERDLLSPQPNRNIRDLYKIDNILLKLNNSILFSSNSIIF